MPSFDNNLRHLAAQVGKGDARAVAELEQELGPQMHRIVRRAMRATAGPSVLTRRVRAAAHRLSQEGAGRATTDPEQLVHRVAHDLCASVIGQLQAGRRDGHLLRETVRT
jgi:hypothetical protein